MRGACLTAAACVSLLTVLPAAGPPATLLTIAQRDRTRSYLSPASASVTSDGRHIAFSSYERLAAADRNDRSDIYVLDRESGVISLESGAADGTELGADCLYPRLSADGRFLVFEGALQSPPEAGVFADVIWRDRQTGISRRVSRGLSGVPTDGWSGSAGVSDDGATVVFESMATNLVPGIDANGPRPDVFVADMTRQRLRRIAVATNGDSPADGASSAPTVSGDGRYVAFATTALGDAGRGRRRAPPAGRRPIAHILVHDTQLDVSRRITAGGGSLPNDWSARATISRDGRFVAFVSAATNLIANDDNRAPDVFLYDVVKGTIALVSRNQAGRSASGTSGNPSISPDGRFVAFQSDAPDMLCGRRCRGVPEDINLLADVFLFDRTGGAMTWISTSDAGVWMEESSAPALDASGRILAFTSRHPTHALDTAHDFDLFVRVAGSPD